MKVCLKLRRLETVCTVQRLVLMVETPGKELAKLSFIFLFKTAKSEGTQLDCVVGVVIVCLQCQSHPWGRVRWKFRFFNC